MKKFLLSLTFFLVSHFLVQAQFKKGDILLGGQLGYSSYEITPSVNQPYAQYYKTTLGYYSIAVGKAISEHSVAGVTFSFSPETMSNVGFDLSFNPLEYSENSFSSGIFYRSYKSLGKDFFLFGEINLSYQWSNESGKDSNGIKVLSGSSSGGFVSVYPGIAYKISKRLLVEVSVPNIFTLNYLNTETYLNPDPAPSKTKNFSVNTSLNTNPLGSIGVGFRLVL